MLTETQYLIERAICDKASAYADATRGKRNYLTAEEAAHPDYAACNNDMRGRVEQYELLRDMPENFAAYLSGDNDGQGATLDVTVWTGLPIGRATVRTVGSYRPMHGERQRYGRAMINGKQYAWQGQGKGMYATFRAIKG